MVRGTTGDRPSEPAPDRRWSADLGGTLSVVIGASQGIGASIAIGLAGAGSRVVIAARSEDGLERTRGLAAPTARDQIDIRTVDVTAPESLAGLAEAVLADHGPATILVNSAGGGLSREAFDVTVADWDLVLDTHLRGTFFACQAFGRAMAGNGYGKIINLSSTWAATVAERRSVYAAAKAGVSHLTAALAAEWAPLGIRVNAIAPTATRTPRVEQSIAEEPERETYLVERIPLGRLATPEDVVGSALFLASPVSDFVTGHTLFVDGGWRAAK